MKKFLLNISVILFTLCANAQSDSLRISILGDSYSTFVGWVVPDTNLIWYYPTESQYHQKGNDVCAVEQTWWHQVIMRMGAKLERNNAYSGATICYTGYRPKKDMPHADYSDRAFITRSNWLGNPDVILVCGATNDSWCGAPIGDYIFGNWTDKQLYSFRPAMAKLLYDLKGNYPKARIVFILNSMALICPTGSIHHLWVFLRTCRPHCFMKFMVLYCIFAMLCLRLYLG